MTAWDNTLCAATWDPRGPAPASASCSTNSAASSPITRSAPPAAAGPRRQLEYDFVVAPGADPGSIRLSFAGTPALTGIETGKGGELIVHTAQGDLVQRAPEVYQEGAGGRREPVAGRWLLRAARHAEAGFAVGPYDRSRRLVIDPVLGYATLVGGAGSSATGIAVDAAGYAYVTGSTNAG